MPFASVGIISTTLPSRHRQQRQAPQEQQSQQNKKKSTEQLTRPQVCWPQALPAVRGWLEPWVLLQRYWHAWSKAPPPLALQHLLDWLEKGNALFLYQPP